MLQFPERARKSFNAFLKRHDLLAKPDDIEKKSSRWGQSLTLLLSLFFLIYCIWQIYSESFKTPIFAYSYPDTSSDYTISLNYTNFAIWIADYHHVDQSSNMELTLIGENNNLVSFIPVNSSSILNLSVSNSLTVDQTVLISTTPSTISFTPLDCSITFQICLFSPNPFNVNQTTGFYEISNSYSPVNCVPLYSVQFAQYTSVFSPTNYSRNNRYVAIEADSRSKWSPPDYLTFLTSYPQTCTAGVTTIAEFDLSIAKSTEVITINYPTILGYFSAVGGLWTSATGFAGIISLVLWWIFVRETKIEAEDTNRPAPVNPANAP